MLSDILLGLGLVAVIEGLVLALAPVRFEDLLEALRRISPETRRMIGISVATLGVVLVWFAKA